MSPTSSARTISSASAPAAALPERTLQRGHRARNRTMLKSIVEDAFGRTVTLLRAQRDVLDRGARRLLEHETLDEADLAAIRTPEPAPAV